MELPPDTPTRRRTEHATAYTFQQVAAREKNFEIARLFDEVARSLDVKGEQGHRPRAYRRAARAVAAYPVPVEHLAQEGRLREIPGIGPSLEALISEYLATGQMRTHARLVEAHPPGLVPLLSARGFGPAAIGSLVAALGVTHLDDIERAAQEGRLPGAIGPKRAADLIAQLPALRNPIRRLRLKSAWELAHEVVALMGATEGLQVAGAARRMCDLVEGGLDFVSRSPGDVELFVRLPSVDHVVERTADSARLRLYDGVEVRLYVAEPAHFGAALLWQTGSEAHLRRLKVIAEQRGLELGANGLRDGTRLVAGGTEEDVYRALEMPWIAPELREDDGEIEAALTGELPELVQETDLKGDMHCHTHWTDGSNSLEEMARAAQARGYAYMALTDHSRNLAITNGLSLERLEEARRCVAQLNHDLAPFVILLGTEMDILADGSLDYPDDVLASLDYVSASVHSRFKQASDAMTARILRAVTHPLVHTLNHPHGRLLTMRPAYAVDMPKVIEAAARSGCAMEVSGDPARMDLDGGWARRVRGAGGRCTISSDAHSTLDYNNIWLGVGSARRGWLEPQDVLNTRPVDELRALLRRRQAPR
jgi:DNA polymerase (family X)